VDLVSTDIIRDVRLWGVLGERFGHHHRLVVNSPAECIAAIEANRPGFMAYLGRLHDEGFGFACCIGDKSIRSTQMDVPLGAESFEIAPIIRGASGQNGGVIEIILGVVLIAAGTLLLGPGGALGAAGSVFGGIQGGGFLASAALAQFVTLTGVSLALTGVTSLLTPKPKLDVNQDEGSRSRPSDFFGGAVNTVAQGQCVPVLLGQLYIGSATISIGVENEDRTANEIGAP